MNPAVVWSWPSPPCPCVKVWGQYKSLGPFLGLGSVCIRSPFRGPLNCRCRCWASTNRKFGSILTMSANEGFLLQPCSFQQLAACLGWGLGLLHMLQFNFPSLWHCGLHSNPNALATVIPYHETPYALRLPKSDHPEDLAGALGACSCIATSLNIQP